MIALPTPHDETPTLAELRDRLATLAPDRVPRWGRMSAAQMLMHCRDFNRLCLGRIPVGAPTRWIARMVGPMFLRRFLAKSPLQAPRNLRTLEQIRATDDVDRDFDRLRTELLATVDELDALRDGHVHPLYGPMRAVDVRSIARHHMAHHANQFGLLPDREST